MALVVSIYRMLWQRNILMLLMSGVGNMCLPLVILLRRSDEINLPTLRVFLLLTRRSQWLRRMTMLLLR